jgi:prepilin-type N-terminal cleavage/methylation domain-containing protein
MSFKKSQQGFSLLELIVVITIFLIITAVVMADIPGIGRKGALELTAQEVAGCIRAAQTYGTSAKVVDSNIQSIGAFLNIDNNKIVIFADSSEPHNKFDSNDSEIETCSLDGYTLELFGVNNNPLGAIYSMYTPTNYQVDTMSTLEPTFYNDFGSTVNESFIRIKIKSLRNEEFRCAYIYSSGQITVDDCS